MADRYELAFLKNALGVNLSANPQEQTALESLIFQRLLTGNFQIDNTGAITITLSGLQLADGTVTTPALPFANELTTGRYRIGAGDVGESVLGLKVLDWTGTRLQLTGLNLIFSPDNSADIGASGANRPRDLFLGRNAVIGGTLGVTGNTAITGTLNVAGNTTLANTTLGNASIGGTLGVTGAATLAAASAASLALTTPLPVGSGGIGISGVTSGGVLAATGATTVASSPMLPSGYTVVGGGAGAAPHAVANGAPVPIVLTDAATVNIDASAGTYFSLTSQSSRTIAAPTGGVTGQKMIIEYYNNSGAAQTLTLSGAAGGFLFGTDIPALTSTRSGGIDYIGCVRSALNTYWYVVAYTKV
jgi:hypothetical protein